MPEGYTHVRTARKAAETIHYKIQCPAAFAAGANGPDSFFCFEIWKKRAKRRYDLPGLGNRMHEEKTGAFLRSLCANVKTRPQVEYTLGFLSHYAADTVVHPFICAMCAPGQPYAGKGGHGYLEIALDSTLHAEDTGSALVPVDDVSPLPTGEELADITALLHTCLLETYGEDIPVEYLADAFWHTYRLRGLFPSKHGLRRGVFLARGAAVRRARLHHGPRLAAAAGQAPARRLDRPVYRRASRRRPVCVAAKGSFSQ